MHKNIFIAFLIFLTAVAGCQDNHVEVDMSDPLSSGRGFIEASLIGDYVTAEKYMLKDSTNTQYLEGLKDFSKKLTPIERASYREADIIIDSTRMPDDSTELIYFKNTYKKEPARLKLIKKDNEWRVDFKYTFIDE